MKTTKFFRAFVAVTAAFTGAVLAALILPACTLSLDPMTSIGDSFRFADTNVGILKVVNAAENGAVLYGIQLIQPDKSLSEYYFEKGLSPGNSWESRFPAQIVYGVKFSNGKGWTKNSLPAVFAKDQTFTVTFTGTEEISVDLSGIKGKLTVYNLIPATEGEYVIENILVSSTENVAGQKSINLVFYVENGIHSEEKPVFDVLPGEYWVRAQIKNPKTGKLSKWSIPAHVGSYDTTNKDQFDISAEPGKISISADRVGIAIFNEKVLDGGQPGGDVVIDTPEFPSIPGNMSLDEDGKPISNVNGKIDKDSRPIRAIKVEKLGFPSADQNGVSGGKKYQYTNSDIILVLQEGKIVKTTIYDQTIMAGGAWNLALAEPGWYLLSFSPDNKTFSKTFPIRLEDKNGNGKIDEDEVEPDVIPSYNNDDSTWTEKRGIIVKNNTPAEGGQIYKKDAAGQWVPDENKMLSPADAQKPITDIKLYNLDGSLYAQYRNQHGLPIHGGKEWIITPALDPGDYMISLSDDNGLGWTYPPFAFKVEKNKDDIIIYDKTRAFWERTAAGKPAPELVSPDNPNWNDPRGNWSPGAEINPNNPVYITPPSEPPLDMIPPGTGPKEMGNAEDPAGDGSYSGTAPAPGSQLDIINKEKGFVVSYVKLNPLATPGKVYRIIDLSRITYTDGTPPVKRTGGIPAGKRLSLAGYDFKPGQYYVYLSEDAKVWWKYNTAVDIPTSWTTDAEGKLVPIPASRIEKVIYKDADENWSYPSASSSPDENTGNAGNIDAENAGNTDNENDGGGLNIPPKGFLVIQNLLPEKTTALTIRRPYKDGSFLVEGDITYNQHPVIIEPNKFDVFHLPITETSPYQIGVRNGVSAMVFYKVSIEKDMFTYVLLEGLMPDGSGSIDKPLVPSSAPSLAGSFPDASIAGEESVPPLSTDDVTVISGTPGPRGIMQFGVDFVGSIPNFAETGSDLFDRNYRGMGERRYPSGQVQPYLPYPSSVMVPFPQGGNGTKENMGGRGYFNFRYIQSDSDWGVGYLAIQKLRRRGTSSAKDPVGPRIVLLDAKADTDIDMLSGEGQRKLGNIYNETGLGSIKGEDRSFNDWQKNWLGLVDPDTGWQINVNPDGTLDPVQPVYRGGKNRYPRDRDVAWNVDTSDKKPNRENGVHRALNNPGRLYTTGVTTDGLYAPLGAGFEAGEYRVFLYRGTDSQSTTSVSPSNNEVTRQKKMYRTYENDFDITIYPGVITTAIFQSRKENQHGAFAYTPIPQAAFGKLVILNNPPNNDYTVNAILLDKPGYEDRVNSSSTHEVHRYIAALASTPTSMPGSIPNFLNGNNWGKMNPLSKGGMHTFILPPGGYRIAVQSTRDRDNSRAWYGEDPNAWLPVVITEGDTVYLTYHGQELSR
jgi:hypothetical protein